VGEERRKSSSSEEEEEKKRGHPILLPSGGRKEGAFTPISLNAEGGEQEGRGRGRSAGLFFGEERGKIFFVTFNPL